MKYLRKFVAVIKIDKTRNGSVGEQLISKIIKQRQLIWNSHLIRMEEAMPAKRE